MSVRNRPDAKRPDARFRPAHVRGDVRSDPPEPSNPFDAIPDARDGLTRVQRLLLLELWHVQRELDRETVPSAMLYGRLLEHIDLSPAGFREALATLGLTLRGDVVG